ncbi:hypothetical protein EC973_002844 [Apophysomyces ossiformis]|uniref:Uncharacterized protein n=1 Tax=Apophysomyces ossiformis TaxID=679940 RepID=A0A8H7EQX5_9FUNG|nr:hypothetical protein EC973_002844 [Apophysomyces ossiformis]
MTRGKMERKRKFKTIDQYFRKESAKEVSGNATIDQYFKKVSPPPKRIAKEGPGKENEVSEGEVIVRGLQDRSLRKFGGKLVSPLAPKGGCGGNGIAISKITPQPRKFNVLTDEQIKQGKEFASPPAEHASSSLFSPRSPILPLDERLDSHNPPQRGTSEPPAPCSEREGLETLENVDMKDIKEKKKGLKRSASQSFPCPTAAPLSRDVLPEERDKTNMSRVDENARDNGKKKEDEERAGKILMLLPRVRNDVSVGGKENVIEEQDDENESDNEAETFFSQADEPLDESSPQQLSSQGSLEFSFAAGSQASFFDADQDTQESGSPIPSAGIEFSIPTLKDLEEQNDEEDNFGKGSDLSENTEDTTTAQDPENDSTLPFSMLSSDTAQYDAHIAYPVPRGKTVLEKFGIENEEQ